MIVANLFINRHLGYLLNFELQNYKILHNYARKIAELAIFFYFFAKKFIMHNGELRAVPKKWNSTPTLLMGCAEVGHAGERKAGGAAVSGIARFIGWELDY